MTVFSDKQLSLVENIQPFKSEIIIDTLEDNKYLININLYTDFPSSLPKFQFDVRYPLTSIDVLWSSRSWSNSSFINIPNYSRLQSDYNVVSGLTNRDNNRITMASFDNFGSRYTGIDIKKDAVSLVFSFNFFKTSVPDAEILEYKAQILVDLTDKQYSKSIRECIQWRLDKRRSHSYSKDRFIAASGLFAADCHQLNPLWNRSFVKPAFQFNERLTMCRFQRIATMPILIFAIR